MSETLTSRGGYRSRAISRQLTDAERAMDDQIESGINFQPTGATSTRAAYAWLEEDMRQRASIATSLGAQRAVLAQSADYRDMDRRFNQEIADEEDANMAIREVDAFRRANPNATFGDAISAVTGPRPDLWGNKSFTGFIESAKGLHETDLERQKRESDLTVSVMKNEIASLQGEALRDVLSTPEGIALSRKINEFALKKEANNGTLDEVDLRNRRALMENEYKEQKIKAEMLNSLDTSFRGKAIFTNFMERANIPVEDVDAMGSYMQANPDLYGVITHPSFLKSNPELHDRLAGALSVMQSSQASEDDKRKAAAAIYAVSGAHAEYVAESEFALKNEERARKLWEEDGESYEKVSSEINDLLTMSINPDKPPVVMPADQALSRAELWIKGRVASNKALAGADKEFMDAINKARLIKDDAKKGKQAQYIMGDFMRLTSNRLPEIEKEVTAKTGSGSPSAAPSGLKVGDERKGFIYKGGDPSKPESWSKKP